MSGVKRMEAIRVTNEWQKAAVYYVRAKVAREDFVIPLSGEFSEDAPEHDYVVVMDGDQPVSTCRIRYLDAHTGKIERVATLREYRGKHYGKAGILEAEAWLREKGITRVLINSREEALGFYIKLGYIPDYANRSGSGLFSCVMTEKRLSERSEENE